MQRRLARGEAAALGELYDRFAPLVHHTARRVLADQGAADLVTREVFEHVWENPGAYDPRTDGSLRAWIARLARRRAAAAARADYIVTAMPESLRTALESAYFQRRDCRQTAAHLGVTEEEARRRLRLGLQLLATARTRPPDGAAPGPWGPPL